MKTQKIKNQKKVAKLKINPLKKTFRTSKFKKSTGEILKESDEECWDE